MVLNLFDMKELLHIYKKRKQQLVPLVFGFAAIFVIFRIVMPQISDIQNALTLITEKEAEIKAKEESISLLSSIPNETVDGDFGLVTTALPIQKDIILIFEELNTVANESNVQLGGYSVKVGGIYDSGKMPKKNERVIAGVPFLNILVNVTGESSDVIQFAETLYKSIPLVEIKSVDIGRGNARYDVNFFYKPVAIRPNVAETQALEPLTPAENAQLAELREYLIPSAN